MAVVVVRVLCSLVGSPRSPLGTLGRTKSWIPVRKLTPSTVVLYVYSSRRATSPKLHVALDYYVFRVVDVVSLASENECINNEEKDSIVIVIVVVRGAGVSGSHLRLGGTFPIHVHVWIPKYFSSFVAVFAR